mmetsp:Transcript_68126/g.158094  ORF Transcript_68126/g.158094 Transcript_68126/m.158094 type:complete len:210 (+) Transcript_68126:570-1199(+)
MGVEVLCCAQISVSGVCINHVSGFNSSTCRNPRRFRDIIIRCIDIFGGSAHGLLSRALWHDRNLGIKYCTQAWQTISCLNASWYYLCTSPPSLGLCTNTWRVHCCRACGQRDAAKALLCSSLALPETGGSHDSAACSLAAGRGKEYSPRNTRFGSAGGRGSGVAKTATPMAYDLGYAAIKGVSVSSSGRSTAGLRCWRVLRVCCSPATV